MPTEDWGKYAQGLTLGTQVSSTYEGRHITALASELNHGNVLGVVTKGYPVIFGIVAGAHGVGVAFNTEVAGTDLIAVDTEGIWNLAVLATNDAADAGGVVVAGDPLFINTTSALISKIRDNATQIPFGYALGGIAQDATATIAVKVHWDPRSHWVLDEERFYFGTGADASIKWDATWNRLQRTVTIDITTLPDGYGYIETNLNASGIATGYTVTESCWINLGGDYEVLGGGGLITPHTDGIYQPIAAVITGATIALAGKFTDQMAGADAALYTLWNLNLTQMMDALFEINNPALASYVATAATGANGSICLFTTGGGGNKYLMVYDAPA